jgi:hypothetical protein
MVPVRWEQGTGEGGKRRGNERRPGLALRLARVEPSNEDWMESKRRGEERIENHSRLKMRIGGTNYNDFMSVKCLSMESGNG